MSTRYFGTWYINSKRSLSPGQRWETTDSAAGTDAHFWCLNDSLVTVSYHSGWGSHVTHGLLYWELFIYWVQENKDEVACPCSLHLCPWGNQSSATLSCLSGMLIVNCLLRNKVQKKLWPSSFPWPTENSARCRCSVVSFPTEVFSSGLVFIFLCCKCWFICLFH